MLQANIHCRILIVTTNYGCGVGNYTNILFWYWRGGGQLVDKSGPSCAAHPWHGIWYNHLWVSKHNVLLKELRGAGSLLCGCHVGSDLKFHARCHVWCNFWCPTYFWRNFVFTPSHFLVRAACMRCHGNKCPLLTAIFALLSLFFLLRLFFCQKGLS